MRIRGNGLVIFTGTGRVGETGSETDPSGHKVRKKTRSDVRATGNAIKQQEVGRRGSALIQAPTRKRRKKEDGVALLQERPPQNKGPIFLLLITSLRHANL